MNAENKEKTPGFFSRLRARLNKGDSWLTYDLANLAPGGRIDEDTLDELETLLVMADVGISTTEKIIDDLRKQLARKELKDIDALSFMEWRSQQQSRSSNHYPWNGPGDRSSYSWSASTAPARRRRLASSRGA